MEPEDEVIIQVIETDHVIMVGIIETMITTVNVGEVITVIMDVTEITDLNLHLHPRRPLDHGMLIKVETIIEKVKVL